jgi:hypothetical protein
MLCDKNTRAMSLQHNLNTVALAVDTGQECLRVYSN